MAYEHLLTHARAIMKDVSAIKEPIVAAAQPIKQGHENPPRPDQRVGIACYNCNSKAKYCLSAGQGAQVRCYRCDRLGTVFLSTEG